MERLLTSKATQLGLYHLPFKGFRPSFFSFACSSATKVPASLQNKIVGNELT